MIQLHRACPICDWKMGYLLHSTRYQAIGESAISQDTNVVACEHCGFCFADTRASQADYDAYYRERSKYADASLATGSGTSPYDQERLRLTVLQIESHAPQKDQRLLDLGCATGGLLLALRAAGFTQLTGIDPAADCIHHVIAAGLNGHVGNLFEPPPNIGSFDGIILSHVLEHVCDLRRAIRAIKSLVAPNGWFYFEVPDASRYEHFLRSPFQDFNTEHINHFSAAALRNLLSQEGLVVESNAAKQIPSAPGITYPALSIFARFHPISAAIQPDPLLAESLRRYITASQSLLSSIHESLLPLVEARTPIMIWGTGQLTMKLLIETCMKDANIIGFVDGNPIHWGQSFRGFTIQSPAEFTDRSAVILLGSVINQHSILRDIAKSKLPNSVMILAS